MASACCCCGRYSAASFRSAFSRGRTPARAGDRRDGRARRLGRSARAGAGVPEPAAASAMDSGRIELGVPGQRPLGRAVAVCAGCDADFSYCIRLHATVHRSRRRGRRGDCLPDERRSAGPRAAGRDGGDLRLHHVVRATDVALGILAKVVGDDDVGARLRLRRCRGALQGRPATAGVSARTDRDVSARSGMYVTR